MNPRAYKDHQLAHAAYRAMQIGGKEDSSSHTLIISMLVRLYSGMALLNVAVFAVSC